ncbi:MAG TPA: GNAT family N-acetyltransferase [Chloroflexia bacterium]|nr:GNAT family N-acetyltransferase [Chloroflexia bacterium]
MGELQIRLALPVNVPSIASVLHQAFIEFESLYTPGGFAATTPTTEQIAARWHEGPVWVALLNSDIVGTVSAVLEGDSLYVRSMAVLPSARGHHIGKLLLDQVESYAREHNCRRMFLCTTPFLSGAIRLYENYGFQRENTSQQDLFGTPIFSMKNF